MVVVILLIPSVDKDGDGVSTADVSLPLTLIINKARMMTLTNSQFFGKTSDGHLSDGQALEVLVVSPEEEVESFVERLHEEVTGPLQQEQVYMEVDGKPSIR